VDTDGGQHSSSSEAIESLAWIRRYRESIDFSIARIPFSDSDQWVFHDNKSALCHASGKFYSVRGYKCESATRPTFYQPLIDQPEIGTQGFVVRRDGSGYELLVQARTEPGNIGAVQFGPTIQATFSNYTTVHGGKRPLFLDYFHEPQRFGARVIIDTTQPELGSKFLRKWNRNLVIECPELSEFSDPMFTWIPLRTLARFMKAEHLVNNDARLVVGLLALEFGPSLFGHSGALLDRSISNSFKASSSKSFADIGDVRQWMNQTRSLDTRNVQEVPLNQLPGWQISEDEIHHQDGLFFSVIQVKVHAGDREVADWDQPLIATEHRGNIVLFCKEEDGVLNFLFRAAPEIGTATGAELQPTICFDNEGDTEIPNAIARLLNDENHVDRLRFEASDEGGRFYQCISQFDVLRLEDSVDPQLPDDYCWLTLAQIRELVRSSDFVSDESRSILSLALAAVYANGHSSEPESS